LNIFENSEQLEKNPELLYFMVLLLFPLCAIIVFLIYLGKNISIWKVVLLHIVKKLPLVCLVVSIVIMIQEFGDFAQIIVKNVQEVVGVGVILTILSSIVLFIDQPKVQFFKKETGQETQNTIQEIESKETANTDDLFN
jgi:hypothetical protein